MTMTRRRFLERSAGAGLAVAVAGPALASLPPAPMTVTLNGFAEQILNPAMTQLAVSANTILTPTQVTKEALRLLEEKLHGGI